MRNVIIIGAGIAGHTAAIYTARATLSPLVIGGPEEGGQLTLTTEVENFPGFEHGIMGPTLVEDAKKQAQRFGAEYISGIVTKFEAINADASGKSGYQLTLSDGSTLQSKTIIIATGASARWLGIESEKQYKGKGVSTCATCDGFFYRGKTVVVVGGGDSAMEEANFLTKFANKVVILHRKDEFRASKIMQEKTFANKKIEVVWNVEIAKVLGNDVKVTGVDLKNTTNDSISHIPTDGVFLAIGHIPNTQVFKGIIDMDEIGYLTTNRFMHTKLPGVFAAGDVQDRRYRQAITAAGTGCQAAIEAERYLAEHESH